MSAVDPGQRGESKDRPTNEYLTFREQWPPTKKTAVVEVMTRDDSTLGVISWFGRWRQYAFHPSEFTTFNQGCLETINAYMAALMDERR